jgi:hypothetical protein
MDEFRIYSSFRPVVPSGKIATLAVAQTLTDGTTQLLDAAGPPVKIAIQGPQTALTEDDIVGVYPAPGSTDSPADFLPHIALTRRTLPWERNGPATGPKAFAPWLALLLVKPSDFPHVTIGAPPPTRGPQKPSAAILPRTIQLNALEKDDPNLHNLLLKTGIAPTASLNVITIAAAKLRKILPPAGDLELLCHVKQVLEPGDDPNHEEDGTFTAIVVGGRLPTAGDAKSNTPAEPHTALLVSLEGRDDVYTQADGNITLVVLHAWTFVPSNGADFQEVCHRIHLRPNGGVLRFGNLPRPAPPPPAPSRAPANPPLTLANPPNTISAGFDSLLDRSGYFRQPLASTEPGNVVMRSPLRPLRPPPRSAGFAIRSAPEDLASADPAPAASPIHDYSHAIAFELGKLLALADAGVREDLRAIHAGINVPTNFVAMSALPPALQKPYWGIDQGDPLETAQQQLANAQQQLAQALQNPWASALGQANLVTIQAGLGTGAMGGVSSGLVTAWQSAVEVAMETGPGPGTTTSVGQIDIGTVTESTLAANFPAVINAAPERGQ